MSSSYRTHGAVEAIDGRCYRAAGATLGSDSIGGSVRPLVDHPLGHPLRLSGVLTERLAQLRSEGLAIDRVVRHPSESDFDTAPATYAANLRHVIAQVQAAYPTARFYVAQDSACMTHGRRFGRRASARLDADS